MTTETIETPAAPPEQADPEQTPVVTETPPPQEEGAAPPEDAAAVPQVQAVEEKPDYITRADWEKEKAEVAQRAAADALEADRRRRQTENARKAQAEERQKARIQQTVDTVKATLVARGIDPEVATEPSVVTAIDRVAQERAEALVQERGSMIADAWEYLTAPIYGQQVSLDDAFAPIARELGPKVQHLIDAIKPAIEAEARKDYISKNEIPEIEKRAIERHLAKARENDTPLQRPEGTPASTVMSWADYMALPEETRIAMPDEKRREIMAADRKARMG